MKQSQLKYSILLLIAMWCMTAFTAQAQSNVVWQSKKDRTVKIEQNGERYSAKGDVTEAIIKEFKTWVRQQLNSNNTSYSFKEDWQNNVASSITSQLQKQDKDRYNKMLTALEAQKRVTDRKLSNQAKNGETDESRMQNGRMGSSNQFGANATANNYYAGPNRNNSNPGFVEYATYKNAKVFNKNKSIGAVTPKNRGAKGIGLVEKFTGWVDNVMGKLWNTVKDSSVKILDKVLGDSHEPTIEELFAQNKKAIEGDKANRSQKFNVYSSHQNNDPNTFSSFVKPKDANKIIGVKGKTFESNKVDKGNSVVKGREEQLKWTNWAQGGKNGEPCDLNDPYWKDKHDHTSEILKNKNIIHN